MQQRRTQVFSLKLKIHRHFLNHYRHWSLLQQRVNKNSRLLHHHHRHQEYLQMVLRKLQIKFLLITPNKIIQIYFIRHRHRSNLNRWSTMIHRHYIQMFFNLHFYLRLDRHFLEHRKVQFHSKVPINDVQSKVRQFFFLHLFEPIKWRTILFFVFRWNRFTIIVSFPNLEINTHDTSNDSQWWCHTVITCCSTTTFDYSIDNKWQQRQWSSSHNDRYQWRWKYIG